MADILDYLKQITNAVYGKDVRSSIVNAIRQCYDDGKAGATDLLARERISNLAKLTEGSTTGDAELADLRVGVDGKTYQNAGDAVRGQVSELKDDLGELQKNFSTGINLLDSSKIVIGGGYINTVNGGIVPNSGWSYYDFLIPIDPSEKYFLYNFNDDGSFSGDAKYLYVAFYDESLIFVSGYGSLETETFENIEIPSDARFVKISGNNANIKQKSVFSNVGNKSYVSNNGYVPYEKVLLVDTKDTKRIDKLDLSNVRISEKSNENLLHCHWEDGGIEDDGSEIVNVNAIRTSFIELSEQKYFLQSGDNTLYTYLRYYDENKHFMSYDNKGILPTIFIDNTVIKAKYLRIMYVKTGGANIPENAKLFLQSIGKTNDYPYYFPERYIRKSDDTILTDTPEEYFVDEANTTIDSIVSKIDAPCLILTIVTDTHHNPLDAGLVRRTKETFSNIKYVNKKVPSHGIVHLGDYEDSSDLNLNTKGLSDKTINIIRGYMCEANDKVFMVNGNHDGYLGTTRTDNYGTIATHNQDYVVRDSASPWFYYDYDSVKVRCIFLQTNSADLGIGNRGYSTTQLTWLESVLKETPNDYNIMVFQHIGLFDPQFNYGKQKFIGLTNGFNSHNGDFASKNGKILAMFVGREHGDCVAYETDTGLKYPTIVTNCSWYYSAYQTIIPTLPQANIPSRTRLDYTQDCWDTIVYRPDEQKIYLIRFGAGDDTTICGVSGKNGDRIVDVS